MQTKVKIFLLALSLCALVGLATSELGTSVNNDLESIRSRFNPSIYESEINKLISELNNDPTDVATLLQLQMAMQRYSLAISAASSVMKSLQDTLQQIVQRIGEKKERR